MSYIQIKGGRPLHGSVDISGFKNAALPILFATLLVKDVCVIYNLPCISDTRVSLDILRSMGATVTRIDTDTYEIDTRGTEFCEAPQELVRALRGSYYLMGAQLGRFRRAKMGEIGGCDFGTRPIDQHIKVFRALGATVNFTKTSFVMCASRLIGNRITFDVVSVGATVNAILAAVLAEGRTVLCNCAREPHVCELVSFLNRCGASISGAGTSKLIIDGVSSLHGCECRIMPDMIEAGTYMIIGAIPGNDIEVCGADMSHMSSVTSALRSMGASVTEDAATVRVRGGRLVATDLVTGVYPALPSDMHPQMSALMCIAEGRSSICERVWSSRFKYADEMRLMGADISVRGDTAYIQGGAALCGSDVTATDLRAGAALIICALCASGESRIYNFDYVRRGYENIAAKLQGLGADVAVFD